MLADLSLRDFVERISAKTSTPGGGSAAAAASAMGAALGIMAARFTQGSAGEEGARKLEDPMRGFLDLVDRDAEAYGRVRSAMGMPKSTDEEKKARKEALQTALLAAADVPLEGMSMTVDSLSSLHSFADGCNANLISDLGSAALLLEAGLFGCSLNVQINARSIHDAAEVDRLNREAGRLLGEGARLRREIMDSVQKQYAGK